ncbi:energy transducer TonB [Shinella sp. WSJ-2]|uniref:energy transducer TonB family protein n=1 Tax=Shinella sp. WSJ-2 TaxID=2303749 RepID=UPI000E3DDED3|nr:TonB family protein [Shinella sp. WSJ-2]RFZ84004.1 energy transducer TonB [Shinella sp. WSJ-2]
MSGSKWLWVGGGVLSLLAHATAAAILTMSPAPEEEQALIAGGVVAEVAMLGNGAFEAVESGNPEDAIQPETIEPDFTEPEPQQVAEIQPTEIQPETTEIAPVDPVVAEPVQELIVPSAEVEIAAVPVPEIKPVIEPEEEIKPVPEVKKEEPVKKVERKKPKEKPVKKAGEKGKAKQNATRGEVDGSADVKSAAVGGQKKGNSSSAGNAAVSNYPGKVRNKINRAKKRVSGGERGSVVVSFTVSSGGQASGIRVARSSGSAALDRAALDSVQRAAPFAKIPEAAGRSSWAFNVPIVFN